MGRSFAAALGLALAAPVMLMPATSRGADRSLPMQFTLRTEGPAKACGDKCRRFVFASGAITAATPRDFKKFAQSHDLAGSTVVLDSDGGSVHGAIAFGREIRKLRLDTTVGRAIDLAGNRAGIAPRANCESMCAFVLVAGVHRTVPPDARVMVHQIWLGDRREDPTAATYSAEDLVLVQRDIGRLVRYTADMGASMELIDLALRIPPWEPMHVMTRSEMRSARVETAMPGEVTATVAASPPTLPRKELLAHITNGARTLTAISERRWAVVERAGHAALARRHPLTVAGEAIGSFDLVVACGGPDSYDVSYIEHRHHGRHAQLPGQLGGVTVASNSGVARLKVVSSKRQNDPGELVTYASANVPTALIGGFAAAGDHSLMITTRSAKVRTAIRLGNTGAHANLPRLAAACRAGLGDRASLERHRASALASAR